MPKPITRWWRGTSLPNSIVGSRIWTQITSMERPCRSRCSMKFSLPFSRRIFRLWRHENFRPRRHGVHHWMRPQISRKPQELHTDYQHSVTLIDATTFPTYICALYFLITVALMSSLNRHHTTIFFTQRVQITLIRGALCRKWFFTEQRCLLPFSGNSALLLKSSG